MNGEIDILLAGLVYGRRPPIDLQTFQYKFEQFGNIIITVYLRGPDDFSKDRSNLLDWYTLGLGMTSATTMRPGVLCGCIGPGFGRPLPRVHP